MDEKDKEYTKNYEFLINHYGNSDIIKSRLLYWYRVCKDVIDLYQISEIAVINQDALIRMILSYFTDIVRVKEFHGIENINESKKYAFGIYWFLRFHPVQITDPKARDCCSFINERIALNVIVCEFLNGKNMNSSKEYIKHLFHHLKYRTYSARTLELDFDALSVI